MSAPSLSQDANDPRQTPKACPVWALVRLRFGQNENRRQHPGWNLGHGIGKVGTGRKQRVEPTGNVRARQRQRGGHQLIRLRRRHRCSTPEQHFEAVAKVGAMIVDQVAQCQYEQHIIWRVAVDPNAPQPPDAAATIGRTPPKDTWPRCRETQKVHRPANARTAGGSEDGGLKGAFAVLAEAVPRRRRTVRNLYPGSIHWSLTEHSLALLHQVDDATQSPHVCAVALCRDATPCETLEGVELRQAHPHQIVSIEMVERRLIEPQIARQATTGLATHRGTSERGRRNSANQGRDVALDSWVAVRRDKIENRVHVVRAVHRIAREIRGCVGRRV